ncbi:hypothetical protein RIR_jg12801.t1 [Rhizophagus irregularis DAOM 181602=DAOM 197198]|nr:hypothetical protein RIR_jg12801.t1 [Rhizophagus irregularis DAOM 181602=DAOM 197198]
MVFRVYFDTWDFVLNGPERMEEEIGLYFFKFNSFNEIIIHFRRLKDHFEHKFRILTMRLKTNGLFGLVHGILTLNILAASSSGPWTSLDSLF